MECVSHIWSIDRVTVRVDSVPVGVMMVRLSLDPVDGFFPIGERVRHAFHVEVGRIS